MKKTSILEEIIWFPEQENQNLSFNKEKRLIYLRKNSKNIKGTSGILFSEKCGKEIRYDSQIELKFFEKLELAKDVVDYGSQCAEIPYKNKTKKYIPDFYIQFKNGRIAIGEIKLVREMGYYYNWEKWNAMKNFCIDNGLGILITDGQIALHKLKTNIDKQDFKNDLLSLYNNSSIIEWPEVYGLKIKHKASRTDLVKVVVEEKLKWETEPFKLKKT